MLKKIIILGFLISTSLNAISLSEEDSITQQNISITFKKKSLFYKVFNPQKKLRNQLKKLDIETQYFVVSFIQEKMKKALNFEVEEMYNFYRTNSYDYKLVLFLDSQNNYIARKLVGKIKSYVLPMQSASKGFFL